MQITILAIGKKRGVYDERVDFYATRIVSPFRLVVEVLEPCGSDDRTICRDKESEKLLKKIDERDYVIVLDEKGKDISTRQYAEYIDKVRHGGYRRIVCVIGGAYGLDDVCIRRADLVLCLGRLTLPHEIARLVLAEQIYRVSNLLGGGKYHHE